MKIEILKKAAEFLDLVWFPAGDDNPMVVAKQHPIDLDGIYKTDIVPFTPHLETGIHWLRKMELSLSPEQWDEYTNLVLRHYPAGKDKFRRWERWFKCEASTELCFEKIMEVIYHDKPTTIEMAELVSQCSAIPKIGLIARKLSFHYESLEERVKELESQLPEGMQECTILFKECILGHGVLTATNWVQHGCQQCKIEKLEADKSDLRKMISDLLDCPRLEDKATRPSGFDAENEGHRVQLVYSVSCSYDKIHRAYKLLMSHHKPKGV